MLDGACYLLAHGSVPILVHVLEDLLQRSLLAHELAEGKTTIKVPVHSVEELRHLLPAPGGGHGDGDRVLHLHGGVAARGVEHLVPLFLGQLAVSILVSLVEHFADLENRYWAIENVFSKVNSK